MKIDQTVTTPFRAFYSDPHFGHENIISFCDRPYSNVAHMEQEFTLNYNKIVGKDDWVCWVGDCFFGHNAWEGRNVLERMNGHKVLVKGNHDDSNNKMLSMGFALVVDSLHLMIKDKLCQVNHFPYAFTANQIAQRKAAGAMIDNRYADRRPKRVKGVTLIHGHTHSAEKCGDIGIHVGVDAWNYGPAPIEEVAALL